MEEVSLYLFAEEKGSPFARFLCKKFDEVWEREFAIDPLGLFQNLKKWETMLHSLETLAGKWPLRFIKDRRVAVASRLLGGDEPLPCFLCEYTLWKKDHESLVAPRAPALRAGRIQALEN